MASSPLIRIPDEARVQDPARATVTKRFNEARTPMQRVLGSPDVREGIKDELRAIYLELNPAQLKREPGDVPMSGFSS
jgi:hypothetical protein